MDLPHSYRQTLTAMPEMTFGEDRNDFTKKILDWGREQGISAVECLRCAAIKWEAWEVESLIVEIENDRPGALKAAVIRLLKDRFIP